MRILREAGILTRMNVSRPRALLALLLAIAACATPPPAPPPAPKETGELVFWEIASAHPGGGRAWLLGSVHAATPNLVFDPAIERAFTGSEALVIEADVTAVGADGRGFVEAMLKQATLPEGRTLDQLLTKPAWEQLAEFLRARGQSPDALRRFEPWLVMTMVTAYYFAESGLPPSGGVDLRFTQAAEKRRIPIVPLETPEFQVSLLDSLPLDTQSAMLEQLLGHETESRTEAMRVYDAWVYGDLDAIERTTTSGIDDDPKLREFHERVYVKRNQNMAGHIDELLVQPRTWFVVLGAGHMVGTDGIPTLLAARGHRVTRIPKSAPAAAPASPTAPPAAPVTR
jgi:uncharacterized protein YbaP (TraB family)